MEYTELLKLDNRTRIDAKNILQVVTASWSAWGAVAPIMDEGGAVVGYANETPADDIKVSRLPVEFFNHEIMGFKLSGRGFGRCAVDMLSRYGAPYLPTVEGRGDIAAFYSALMAGAYDVPGELSAICRGHAAGWASLGVEGGAADMVGSVMALSLRGELVGRVISACELRAAVKGMRGAFGSMLAAVDASISEPNPRGFYAGFPDLGAAACDLVGAWADRRERLTLGGGSDDARAGDMVAAICYQFMRAAAYPSPWRRCLKCGRLFKWRVDLNAKRRNRGYGYDHSTYCTKQCETAARVARYRANEKLSTDLTISGADDEKGVNMK